MPCLIVLAGRSDRHPSCTLLIEGVFLPVWYNRWLQGMRLFSGQELHYVGGFSQFSSHRAEFPFP